MALKCRVKMGRREYPVNITLNGIFISKVIVDTHYEKKHRKSVNDEIILNLVQTLNGKTYEPVSKKSLYSYFVDRLSLNNKMYKLIWLLEEDEFYVGIINVYRS